MHTLNPSLRTTLRTLALIAISLMLAGSIACDSKDPSDSNKETPANESPSYEEAMSPAAKEIAHEHEKYEGWCHGHDLPEAYCTKCNPELAEKYKAEGDWCEAHEFPESACPICNPMTPPEGS